MGQPYVPPDGAPSGGCRRSHYGRPAVTFDLADVFEAVALAVPRRTAVVAVGDRSPSELTYAELAERTARLAVLLRDRGVGPGDRVGILLPNGARHVEALVATLRAGAVPVNVNPRLVPGELQQLLTVSGVRLLVHEPSAAVRADALAVDSLPADWESALADASPDDLPPRPADATYVLYTGGTTGRPKGVLWRQHDLYRSALTIGEAPPATPGDAAAHAAGGRPTRCLVACSLSHGTGQWMALRALLAGDTLVLRTDRHLDPDAVWDTASRERVAWLVVVGDAIARPLATALAERGGRSDLDLGHLTVIVSGGAPLSPATVRELLELLPAAIVVDGFGASETGGQGRRVMTAGGACLPGAFVMGADTAVLGDDLRPLPPGDPRPGLLARCGAVPLGYDADPEATAAAFPVVDGVRWALTGDRARVRADGTVVVLGRGATTITSGGEKVHAEEVEAVLREHPAVLDAVVVGVDDARWGERVTAVVEPRAGRRPTLDALADHCRASLAAHKIPRGLVLVDAVVRHDSGKPDYRWARGVAAGQERSKGGASGSS